MNRVFYCPVFVWETCQACAVEDGDTRVKVPDAGRAVSSGKPISTGERVRPRFLNFAQP